MWLLVPFGTGLLVYLIFLGWYDGWPRRKLAPEEVEALVARMRAQREANGRADETVLERFRAFGASDDGREFYMVNLIRNRKGEGIEQAHRAYMRAWSKPAVPRASHAIFRGRPSVKLFGLPDAEKWDAVAVMRYRSRRDFFHIVTDEVFARDAALKGVAVAYTDVYPTPVGFMATPPRLFVLVALLLLAAVLSLVAGGAW